MKKIRLIALGLSILLCSGIFTGCSKVKDIKMTSFGVESFTPKGLRSAEALLAIGIDNPAFAFTLTSIDGTIRYKGEEIARFSADTVSVEKKCVKVYDVPVKAVLSDNVGIGRLLAIAGGKSLSGLTADVNAAVKLRSGVKKTLKFKNLDIEKLANE